ncbi:hypothetical protein SCAR479_11927 [Seiridium cardinale]|uniref:Luciferase domain-containing protein n=1 Tax=Seiridium cardinale TaxID=138064 RepID=A0ABR2XCE2_9PEZI
MEAISHHLSSAQSFVRNRPLSAAAIATGAALAPLLVVAYNDYRFYVSMGPHGLPDNLWGYCVQLLASPLSRKDTTVPGPYNLAKAAKANGPNSTESYLQKPLKPRSGDRPELCGFVAPQRQLTEQGTDEMKKAMNAYLDEFVAENSSLFQRELSRIEGPFPAVQLNEGSALPPFLPRGELIHVHPHDGSTHVVLSLVDSATVIEKGWGQRHRLSGTFLTWGYTLVYAPRNKEEFTIWKDIVAAGASFSSAGLGSVKIPSAT